ncbi:MAG: hypothetical protein ACLR23_25905 [Clostridia bacterium]
MDYCRAFLEGQPKEFFQSYRDMLMEYREKLQRVPSFILLEKREQRWDLDPAKIVLHSRAKVSGSALAHCLRKDYGIELEGAFGGNLVGISTIADSRESFQQFYQGFALWIPGYSRGTKHYLKNQVISTRKNLKIIKTMI